MKKNPYYMTFYKDLALLQSVYNKQTLFLSEMISRMDGENIVQMTSYTRKAIIDAIGAKSNDKLALARQYIKTLSKAGVISDIGDGAYMVIPRVFGFSSLTSLSNKKQERYIKIKYSPKGRQISVGESYSKDNK